jgi:hypothetical protein
MVAPIDLYLDPNLKRKGRAMKNITAVRLTALLVLTISLNLACQKQAAPPSSGAGAGNEIQNAQQTLDKMRATTSFEQFPDLLTNRTAAGMSFPLVIFAQMGIAFNSGELQPGGAENANNAGASEKAKQMKTELEAILKRYGMDEQTMSDESKRKAVESQIESRGRELLTDLVAFIKKTSNDSENKEAEKPPALPPNDALTFESLSPTAVKITPKDGKALAGFERQFLEARLEDGKWRIDAGGIDEIMASMKKSMESGPDKSSK